MATVTVQRSHLNQDAKRDYVKVHYNLLLLDKGFDVRTQQRCGQDCWRGAGLCTGQRQELLGLPLTCQTLQAGIGWRKSIGGAGGKRAFSQDPPTPLAPAGAAGQLASIRRGGPWARGRRGQRLRRGIQNKVGVGRTCLEEPGPRLQSQPTGGTAAPRPQQQEAGGGRARFTRPRANCVMRGIPPTYIHTHHIPRLPSVQIVGVGSTGGERFKRKLEG